MNKQIDPLQGNSEASPEHASLNPENLLNSLKDKELNETLKKVKLQVKNLVEQTQSKAKAEGVDNKEALEKAKALERLVGGVDQIITSLYQLRQ